MRQYDAFNTLVAGGAINPCLTQVATLPEAASLHEQLMANCAIGNLALLVGVSDRNSR